MGEVLLHFIVVRGDGITCREAPVCRSVCKYLTYHDRKMVKRYATAIKDIVHKCNL